MIRRLFCVAMLLAGASLAACETGGGPVKTHTELAAPDDTSAVRGGQMKIAPLDVLDIKVFGASAFDGAYQVDPAGEIKMPLLGVIQAKDMTVFQLAADLERRLGETYLQNPQVSIRMSELYGQRITMDGSIAKPGQIPVRDSMTLLQAIALSGGPTENADPHRVVIFRTIEGKKEAAAFDITKIRKGIDPDPPVYGNDLIVVDGSDLMKGYVTVLRSIP